MKLSSSFTILISGLLLCTISFGQNTVGVLTFETEKTFDGYNLFFPHNQKNVYLIDNCGRIINLWEDDIFRPGNAFWLLENGNLLKTGSRGPGSNQWIHAGGGGEVVQLKSWDDELLWQYTYNDSTKRLHHDIYPMSDGNVLMIAWDRKSAEEAISAGRNPDLLTEGELWPEHIIEVEPIFPDSGRIVWRWNVWDHLIQDFDPAKENFGVVGDHPELIDINYDTSNGEADWLHANAIDYNEDLDQILLNVPTFNEIWIIDHSTTTEQAAGHTGGFGRRGGDLLYRWGNPVAYRAGTTEDQQLSFQHDAHWMDLGLSPIHPDYGKIIVFNNRTGDDYSSVVTLTPPWDMYSWSYPRIEGTSYQPESVDWEYTAPDPSDFYSRGLSSAQRLPNGNTLICSGRQGWIFEITSDEEIVWEYENPLIQGIPAPQGTVFADGDNILFKFIRYPADYPAFDDKDLTPGDYVEANPNTEFCPLTTTVDNLARDPRIGIFPNPVASLIRIEWTGKEKALLELYDLLGRNAGAWIISSGVQTIDVSALNNGVYLLFLNKEKSGKMVVRH